MAQTALQSRFFLSIVRFLANNPRYFKRLKLDYPHADTTRGSRRFVRAMKQLDVSFVRHLWWLACTDLCRM